MIPRMDFTLSKLFYKQVPMTSGQEHITLREDGILIKEENVSKLKLKRGGGGGWKTDGMRNSNFFYFS